MKIYMAPLEGITDYTYRNIFNKYFKGVDRFYTPFLAPNIHGIAKDRGYRGTLLENNHVPELVPQLLLKDADRFTESVTNLMEYGYRKFNLNVGCPSATVVSKGKGSGLLKNTDDLERLLYGIFDWRETHISDSIEISVKTRIGIDSAEEFPDILNIYNRYPLSELIVHPRLQKDMYKNHPNMDVFRYAIDNSKAPVCYNGDINSYSNYIEFINKYNNLHAVMIGRGFIKNPGLIDAIVCDDGVHEKNRTNYCVDRSKLRNFHAELFEEYSKLLFGDKNILFHMKEIWGLMVYVFEDSEKVHKKIKKTQSCDEYRSIVDRLFRDESEYPLKISINNCYK